MKRGYIWTALTQHIKPGVEGGGRQRPVVLDVRSHRVNTDGERTRPARMGHTGGRRWRCSLFWIHARSRFRPQAARREQNEELLLLSRPRRPSVTCGPSCQSGVYSHVIFYSVYVSYPALNPRFHLIIQLPVYIILTF